MKLNKNIAFMDKFTLAHLDRWLLSGAPIPADFSEMERARHVMLEFLAKLEPFEVDEYLNRGWMRVYEVAHSNAVNVDAPNPETSHTLTPYGESLATPSPLS